MACYLSLGKHTPRLAEVSAKRLMNFLNFFMEVSRKVPFIVLDLVFWDSNLRRGVILL